MPAQLSSDIRESSSAQQATRAPGESGPFHRMRPSVVLYQEVNKLSSSSGHWIWPGVRRNHRPSVVYVARAAPETVSGFVFVSNTCGGQDLAQVEAAWPYSPQLQGALFSPTRVDGPLGCALQRQLF